jgi:hypothetical protein
LTVRLELADTWKDFARSFARSTWHLQDADGSDAGTARERNLFAAMFRRYITLVPYVGELLGFLPIAYDFDFVAPDGTRQAVLERLGASGTATA